MTVRGVEASTARVGPFRPGKAILFSISLIALLALPQMSRDVSLGLPSHAALQRVC